MISLGCAKNLVDAEIMLGSVLQRGMEITSRADEADVLVVNTCAFIDSAKEESIEAILEAHQQRGLNKRSEQKLIVSGCMSQRFARELREAMPEVDAFIGLDQVREARRDCGEDSSKRATLDAAVQCRTLHGQRCRSRFRRQTPDLHSGLGHAALPAHARAQRLSENRRGLQSSVQFLCHPADARPASQPHARVGPGGDSRPRRRRREGDQSHQPGHDLLRNGFVDGEGRAAPAGRFIARPDARRPSSRNPRRSRAISGCACFTRIRRIGAMN